MNDLTDALDGMTAKQVERLVELAQRRLHRCAICGNDGAESFRVSHRGTRFSMMFCPACVQKHRLPEGRSEEAGPAMMHGSPL